MLAQGLCGQAVEVHAVDRVLVEICPTASHGGVFPQRDVICVSDCVVVAAEHALQEFSDQLVVVRSGRVVAVAVDGGGIVGDVLVQHRPHDVVAIEAMVDVVLPVGGVVAGVAAGAHRYPEADVRQFTAVYVPRTLHAGIGAAAVQQSPGLARPDELVGVGVE